MNVRMRIALSAIALTAVSAANGDGESRSINTAAGNEKAKMYAPIAKSVVARQAEFNQIDEKRKAQLDEVSRFIRAQAAAKKPIRLVFICTHNSRRSHMGQLWAALAAETYGIRASVYSGGTEATAFNPRAVAAMERTGFRVEKTTEDENPIYHLRFSDDRPPLTCFSKRHDNAPNPKEEFAAIMVCSDADKLGPAVPGAAARFSIPYADPKSNDGQATEAATYDERCAQIAREMLYVMSRVGG